MQALDPLATIPVAALLPIAILVGVYEEIAFRGLLLSRLRTALAARLPQSLAVTLAVILSSAIFALGHGYQGVLGIVQTAAAGIAFAILALWRKSIWPCIFAHIAIDTLGLVALRILRPALESMVPR
jgi:membrane protease YdiL (CAAX protease family)